MRLTQLPVRILLVMSLGYFAGCQANTAGNLQLPHGPGASSREAAKATVPPASSSGTPAPAPQAYAKGLPGVDAAHSVAVLLPMHGKLAGAGQAIQQGMITSWFRQRAAGLPVPELRFLDSSGADFDALYDAAVDGGADIVIGPLEKTQLRALQQRPRLPVTTIALNYADSTPRHEHLFFFGLAGEDEATQVARHLLTAGLTRPAILLPTEEWAQRIAQQFADTMRQGGAPPPLLAAYHGNGDYGEVIKSLLNVSASEVRHRRLERLLGTTLGFQASIRRDIDSLFIISNTLQGTQLVPAIRYHHADYLPMYATSHINSQPTPDALRDLDGIRFVEMPWISREEQPLREDLREISRDGEAANARLNALGADALLIAGHLAELQYGHALEGVTGRLTLDSARAVRRELDWMQFRSGAAVRDDRAN